MGSDSEGSSLPRSLGGVSGAGQSNLSTEVAALIQSEMASQSRRRQLQQQNGAQLPVNSQNGERHEPVGGGARTESPDMDFLEMDFDPGDESDSEKSHQSTPEIPNHSVVVQRPQELRLEVIEEPAPAPETEAVSNKTDFHPTALTTGDIMLFVKHS